MTKRITIAQAADMLRKSGAVLQRMHTRHGLQYFIVPGGEIPDKIATELIERPDVQPGGDGLFPGISQTFRLGRRP